jgi:hypothetical protein
MRNIKFSLAVLLPIVLNDDSSRAFYEKLLWSRKNSILRIWWIYTVRGRMRNNAWFLKHCLSPCPYVCMDVCVHDQRLNLLIRYSRVFPVNVSISTLTLLMEFQWYTENISLNIKLSLSLSLSHIYIYIYSPILSFSLHRLIAAPSTYWILTSRRYLFISHDMFRAKWPSSSVFLYMKIAALL